MTEGTERDAAERDAAERDALDIFEDVCLFFERDPIRYAADPKMAELYEAACRFLHKAGRPRPGSPDYEHDSDEFVEVTSSTDFTRRFLRRRDLPTSAAPSPIPTTTEERLEQLEARLYAVEQWQQYEDERQRGDDM